MQTLKEIPNNYSLDQILHQSSIVINNNINTSNSCDAKNISSDSNWKNMLCIILLLIALFVIVFIQILILIKIMVPEFLSESVTTWMESFGLGISPVNIVSSIYLVGNIVKNLFKFKKL
jgi:hypothetical protein